MRRTIPDSHRRFAQAMRNQPTDAEAALWSWLRGRKLAGLRFRRQHPMAGYIVDFVCVEARLIIEVNGSQHADSSRDRRRDGELTRLGYRVLRFCNDDELKNIEGVAEAILAASQDGRQ